MKKQLLTFLALLITGIISAQVGIGTTDPKSGLDINTSLGYKVNTITSATTLDDTYNVVLCNNAPYTVTLPPAAANTGRVYRIKNIDPSGDAITIDGNGAETIDGESTYLLQPYKHSITLISNGSNWHVIVNLSLGGSQVGTISSITCGSATNNGTLVSGIVASSVSSEIPYSGGNSGTHDGQTVTSTGVTGLTATLSAGVFASTGNLIYTITGTPASSGNATFALNIGGQSCNLTRTVNAGLITTITCGSATNNGTLVHGVVASGVNSVVPYTGGNAGPHSGQTVTSTGVTGLTATLSAGNFASGSGSLTYTITGTPASSGTATFAINIGGQTCNLTRTVNTGLITGLTCGSATNNGTLTSGTAASGVSSAVPYTGGNAGTHSGQTVTSTGVTGLTATLSAGTFASGSGSLTYNITGTPASSGTATFALNIGGQTCSLTRTVNILFTCGTSTETFTYNGASVTYGTVLSSTGKCWLDRNLGATQVATSSTDHLAYGDLFQWGRGADGHQRITWTNATTGTAVNSTTATLSTTDSPGNALFITTSTAPYDWRSGQNANLWQGVSGVNNPCPSGYRLPTETELEAERNNGGTGFWGTGSAQNNAAGAFASPLKLPMSGYRGFFAGAFYAVGTDGGYWSSTVSGALSRSLWFSSSFALMSTDARAYGSAVRCLKD